MIETLAIVVAAAIALVVFLMARNRRDRRDYEEFLNKDEPFEEDEINDTK